MSYAYNPKTGEITFTVKVAPKKGTSKKTGKEYVVLAEVGSSFAGEPVEIAGLGKARVKVSVLAGHAEKAASKAEAVPLKDIAAWLE